MAAWKSSRADGGFDTSREDFESYAVRCIAHMRVDFQHVCGLLGSHYLEDFLLAWQLRDVHLCGLLPIDSVMALAQDLAGMYDSWVLDPIEEAKMRQVLGHVVSLRDLCLYAERDEQYVVGPDGEETVARLLNNPAAVAPPRLAPAFSSFLEYGLAHLRVDISDDEERVQWYRAAWKEHGGTDVLSWPQVTKLLERAIMRGYSRFGCDGVCTSRSYLEAASLLSVSDRGCFVNFRDLCVAVEAPEPWRLTPAVLSAAASSALHWSMEFHSCIVRTIFPHSVFAGQVACLAAGYRTCGVRLPMHCWHQVFEFLQRDLW